MNNDVIYEDKKKELISAVAMEMLKDNKTIEQNDMVSSFVKNSKSKIKKANLNNLFSVSIIAALGFVYMAADNLNTISNVLAFSSVALNAFSVFKNSEKNIANKNLIKDSNYAVAFLSESIKDSFSKGKFNTVFNTLNFYFDKDKLGEIEAKAKEKSRKLGL